MGTSRSLHVRSSNNEHLSLVTSSSLMRRQRVLVVLFKLDTHYATRTIPSYRQNSRAHYGPNTAQENQLSSAHIYSHEHDKSFNVLILVPASLCLYDAFSCSSQRCVRLCLRPFRVDRTLHAFPSTPRPFIFTIWLNRMLHNTVKQIHHLPTRLVSETRS